MVLNSLSKWHCTDQMTKSKTKTEIFYCCQQRDCTTVNVALLLLLLSTQCIASSPLYMTLPCLGILFSAAPSGGGRHTNTSIWALATNLIALIPDYLFIRLTAPTTNATVVVGALVDEEQTLFEVIEKTRKKNLRLPRCYFLILAWNLAMMVPKSSFPCCFLPL